MTSYSTFGQFPYIDATDQVADYPIVSAALANRIDTLPGRNRVINPRMAIAQRGGSINTTDGYIADRFRFLGNGGGTADLDRPTTNLIHGVSSYAGRVTVNTADASIAAGDSYRIVHRIEGQNVHDLVWGSALSTRTASLSFWVRSSLTGTYCVAIRNFDASRSYVMTYTINQANTWERKVFSIPAATSGSWDVDTGIGVEISWALATGSTFQTTANTWQSGDFRATSAQVNFMSAAGGRSFQLTGVQFELNDKPTTLDWRPHSVELAACQRYYRAWSADYSHMMTFYNSTAAATIIHLATPMRVAPQLSSTGTVQIDIPAGGLFTGTSLGGWNTGNPNGIGVLATGFSGRTAWTSGALQTAHALSAEL